MRDVTSTSPMKSSPFRMPASASGLTWCVHGGVFRLSARRNFYISPVKSSPSRMPASASGLTWCVHGGVFRLSARRNFYISPMKSSPFRMPASPGRLTPVSRRLHCVFGDRPGVRRAHSPPCMHARTHTHTHTHVSKGIPCENYNN